MLNNRVLHIGNCFLNLRSEPVSLCYFCTIDRVSLKKMDCCLMECNIETRSVIFVIVM